MTGRGGAAAPGPLLRASSLRAGFGRSQVVRGFDLDVAAGEVVALLGPNGHGKTTALRCIAGLHPPTAGRVVLDGTDITGWRAERVARLGLTYLPQATPLFPTLTIREVLRLAGRRNDDRSSALAEVEDLFPRLRERRDQLVGTLSGGERQMVAIGVGLMTAPRVLVLDEPTLGLAPKVRGQIGEALARIRATGLALVVADGDIDFLFALADRWQLVELGRVTARGTAAERPSETEVMAMYLGDGEHA